MGLTSIFRGFAALLLVLALAMLGPLIVALMAGEPEAGSYLFGGLAALFVGGGAFAASLGRRPPSDFRGVLIIILLWWAVIPAFAAIPFAMQAMTFSEAYFEAVAAMTTTGGWLSPTDALSSQAGLLWRAELQWLGGLASLTIAAAIFIRPAFIGIDTLLPPFSRGEQDSFLRPLRNAAAAFFSVYAVITFIAFCLLAIAGAAAFDALIMAMSTVASGGFIPHQEGLAGYAPGVTYTLFFFMLLSGANFVLIARVLRGSKGRVKDVETFAYLLIALCVGVLFWVLAGAGDVVLAGPQIFNAVSLLSTNGVIIGEAPPLAVMMVTAIIGGAAVSTAGGFKILRWLVIMRRAREEIRRLVSPSGVFGQRRVANEFGVWIHFLVFTFVLAALLAALSVGGHNFDLAAATAVAALSNTGPLVYLVNGGADGYAVFDGALRWLLVGAMILGRLEAAVALALINRAFWRS
ncbi:MAG: potassium transporter TrkG [Pseudomonadota bacterium]